MQRNYHTWLFPNTPADVACLLAMQTESLVIVGIIGRSKCKRANKMLAFGMQPNPQHTPKDGQILCYYKPGTNTLLLHFETTRDEVVMQQHLDATMQANSDAFDFDHFYEKMRSRFIRSMLLALHICHIVVYVETGHSFDASLITIFQQMKLMRDKYIVDIFPQMLATDLNPSPLGKASRICTPRILFLFENYPHNEEKTRQVISSFEFQNEDHIYEVLTQCHVVTNSSNSSLLALPNNKQFVFYNAAEELRPDALIKALDDLQRAMRKDEDNQSIIDMAPFEGFVKPFPDDWDKESDNNEYKLNHTVWNFLQQHVEDAVNGCFDEGAFENPGYFRMLNSSDFQEFMEILHSLMISNAEKPNFISSNKDYQLFLDEFDERLNFEKSFWQHLCDLGLRRAESDYKSAAPEIYGTATHERLLEDARNIFHEDGRGPPAEVALSKLEANCTRYWQEGRQQCEVISLRGHPCVLPKQRQHEKHNSNSVHISTCNCGRMQGRREDPYTLRQANYEYYEQMANACNLCVKTKPYPLDIFEPSISDYRAAAFDVAFPLLSKPKRNPKEEDSAPYSQPQDDDEQQSLSNGCSQPLSPTFPTDLNLSQPSMGNDDVDDDSDEDEDETKTNERQSRSASISTEASENELVLHIKDHQPEAAEGEQAINSSSISENEKLLGNVLRQASTTEYLPGLVHVGSAEGLLPLFPSWSLACVGPSSIYSHNTGLLEHFQSGFLSGANFLLPWDVHVRVQRATTVAALAQLKPNHHHHHNKKQHQRYRGKNDDRLNLKIFVGFDYECSFGHRFMMCSPDRVLRGGADIERDTSSQVVHNNMPLYYPCPCRAGGSGSIAQLMRIHVVTPKAPVNVIIDPKVRVNSFTFTLGCRQPPRLSQSAYWILRLPFIYQGDDTILMPPKELPLDDLTSVGCILAGMFGVAEMETTEIEQQQPQQLQ